MAGDASDSPSALEALPEQLCRVFLGWRLGDDRDALLALGEGALRIDLVTGECWCDDEPLPALFIAGELMREIDRAAVGTLDEARLDALFAARTTQDRGREVQTLDLTCRVVLRLAGVEYSEQSRNAPGTT